ncbi:chloramphenicol phosphotransferase CPT family protein [Streptomyces sp. NPDC004111]|uniref:chloramphenicol phosphotransferase CPT family protein n=1 Tax=Streptomyces sp. NPDC004111 TaxID=3364690 RepID=UPI0036B40790
MTDGTVQTGAGAGTITDPAHGGIPRTPHTGRVVLLNGTSSSGKSSIAGELVGMLDATWFHMPVDAFHAMRNSHPLAEADVQAEIDRTCKGFHRAVAGMAAAGNNVVVDYPLSRRWRLLDLLDLLEPGRTVLVGVRCALPELERWEAARGDRTPGLAAAQYDRVHSYGPHDLDVHTDRADPRACALRIRDFLAAGTPPAAFATLRRTLRRTG